MLTFAGIPLSIADPGGRVQTWIDAYRPLENLFCEPASYRDGRSQAQGMWGHAVGLPTFNWRTRPPAWRLNTLWWPTGASRFSIGLFLATKAAAKRMVAAVNSDGSGTLKIGDGTRTISPTMYLLPPRPIGSEDASNPAVLIPLVDKRYFWQWAKAGQFFVSPTSTWSDIRTAINTYLGITLTAPDPAGYEAPDWSEFDRWHENPALLLDAYAATVGQRFVATLAGGYKLQKFDDADPIALANMSRANSIAGGSILASPCTMPATVSVVFAKRQGGIVHANGTCDGYQVTAANALANYTNITSAISAIGDVTIHSTYQSDRSTRGSNPDNLTNLQATAGYIARDFLGWRLKSYFGCVAGIASDWNITGFDDYLWYFANYQRAPQPQSNILMAPKDGGQVDSLGSEIEPNEIPGPYLCQTHVESLPHNFGTEENLAQSPSPTAPRTIRPSPVWRAQLTSAWTNPGSSLPHYATARLLYDDSLSYPPSGTLAQDGFDVKIFDTCGIRGSIDSGNKVWVAALPADSEMFELISTSGSTPPQRFQLTADLNTGSSAAAVIRVWNGAAYVDGGAITVFDWWSVPSGRGMWQGVSGMEGWCQLRENETAEYDIVWMEQYARAIEFTLTSDFASGAATATVDASWDQGVSPGSSITVHDDIGEFTDAITGCKGTALRSEYAAPTSPASPYYKVVSSQRVALFLQATLTANMCGSAPTVSAITAETQGQFVVSPGLANTTLTNSFVHYGKSGDAVLMKRVAKTKAGGKWVYDVIDVTKHATAVLTGLRLKSDKTAIEGNFVTAALEYCADAAWSDAIALVSRDVVTNVANATGVISQHKRTLYALADVDGADSTIITLTQKTFVTSVAADSDSLNKVTFTAYVYNPSGDTTTDIIGLTTTCP